MKTLFPEHEMQRDACISACGQCRWSRQCLSATAELQTYRFPF